VIWTRAFPLNRTAARDYRAAASRRAIILGCYMFGLGEGGVNRRPSRRLIRRVRHVDFQHKAGHESTRKSFRIARVISYTSARVWERAPVCCARLSGVRVNTVVRTSPVRRLIRGFRIWGRHFNYKLCGDDVDVRHFRSRATSKKLPSEVVSVDFYFRKVSAADESLVRVKLFAHRR